ncbi:MAG: class I SAM-dependent methyltransferase [Alphaproteobacteria bacterium]
MGKSVSLLRKRQDEFEGNLIAAAPGTHQAVAEALQRYSDFDTPVLDFGCYTGAMLKRLKSKGYSNLWGSDLVSNLEADSDFRFTAADLNRDFSDNFEGRRFGAVVASEVIEHLNDPRHFLKHCYKLLDSNGVIVISTPNIAFFEGRIKFFLKGELWGFGANNYNENRHISPISREQTPLMLQECGFDLLEMFTTATFATPLRKVLTLPLWAPMRALFGPSILGESLVFVARRKDTLVENAHGQWDKPITVNDAAA